jgi:hypothetical protein
MDAFGNYAPKPQDPTSLQGNPFVGSNPQNPSMAAYFNFLQGVLKNYMQAAESQGKPQSPQTTPVKGGMGPMKWNGANMIEVSKGQKKPAENPIKFSMSTPNFAGPSTPQKSDSNYFDPYAAAAQMNSNTMGAMGSWSNNVNMGGYGFGGASTSDAGMRGGMRVTPFEKDSLPSNMSMDESLELKGDGPVA